MTLACGCPEEYPDWDGKDVDLSGQLVHTLPIPMLMHMPLAYELYAKRQQQMVEALQLKEQWPGLVLFRTGFFRGAITRLLEDTRTPARYVHVLMRPFNVRVALHHGNISTGRKVIREVQMSLMDAGRRPKELYLAYITCPHCRDERGGDKMLLLRRWEDSPTLKKRLDRQRNRAG